MTNEIDEILKKTLVDFRLSRSERRALRQLLDELGAERREMDVFRQRAFAVAREELVSPKAVAEPPVSTCVATAVVAGGLSKAS